jgi:hypothetical protein
MMIEARSPRIRELAWGRVVVEGQPKPFKDSKLYPGGAREWDWGETGTRHRPGIQPADLQELLDRGARIVILSQGYLKRLQVAPETLQLLESLEIQTHILQTEKAVWLYNDLCEVEAVGALIHSTC